jgi:hypothetical protein
MTREEVEHVIRAAAAITNERSFVVIGSQALLLPYPDAPAELLSSNEVDLPPSIRPIEQLVASTCRRAREALA